MTGLIDTHAFMWFDSRSSQLSAAARAFIADPGNTVLLSVVSVWEMVIKHQLGKLPVSRPIPDLVSDHTTTGNLRLLPLTLDHVLAVQGLPSPHKDPFDRVLVAQAIAEGAVLLTADPQIALYPVTVVW